MKTRSGKEAMDIYAKVLADCGMPEEKIQELIQNDRVFWTKEDVDSSTIFAAEIIK